MGGGSSSTNKNKKIANPVEQNWQTVQVGQLYNVVRNKTDGRQGQEYSYTLDNRYNPKNESFIFERRAKALEPIIRVWENQFEAKGRKFIPNNFFRVITQRITHRLSDTPQLTFDESLYVLDRALQGYQYLYNNVGAFDVNSNMIGFTPQGQVRVWFNENFGKNYPAHEKKTLQSIRIDITHKYQSQNASVEQIQMVRNIVNVVEDKCAEGRFPEHFSSTIRQLIDFNEARRLVSEQLSSSEIVRLNRVDLFKNLIKSKTGARRTVESQTTRVDVYHQNPRTSIITPVQKNLKFNYQQPNYVN